MVRRCAARSNVLALLLCRIALVAGLAIATIAHAIDRNDYVLGPADHIKISVYEYPDMTTEARISENGKIRFPLVGEVVLGGLTVQEAEARIADKLKSGGFVLKPQVNVLVTSFRSQTVSVLGQVNRAGQYPVDRPSRVSDMLATAGGIAPIGADTIVLTRTEAGKTERFEIDQTSAFGGNDTAKDMLVRGGDVIFVPRQPQFYIHGEVQRPGYYRLESGMTLSQSLAVGGGVTQRGSELRVKVTRRDPSGTKFVTREFGPIELLRPDDVVYVSQNLFYIYGEVQRPGQFRIEPGMTFIQALATGGGITARGTDRGMRVSRRDADGNVKMYDVNPNDPVQTDDVIYVKERLF
jgi:polysaccharide biosynthesis/export protein